MSNIEEAKGKVIHPDQQKIRSLRGNTYPIEQALRYVYVLLGMRGDQLPNEVETAVILDYIQKEGGGLTSQDIRDAFVWAMKQTEQDFHHYGKFSVAYFQKVISHYSVFKRIKQAQSSTATKKEKEWTDAEKKAAHEDFYNSIVTEMLEGYEQNGQIDFKGIQPRMVYANLKALGKAFELDEETKKVIREEAKRKAAEALGREKDKPATNLHEQRMKRQFEDSVYCEKWKAKRLEHEGYILTVEQIFQEIVL